MAKKQTIIDFPKSTITFLKKLAANNNKEWFNAHRDEFETHLYIPAQMFVNEMGDKLKSISPGITAIPKTDKSIFRIHRDVRFSKNKAPYKTNLGMLFWEGAGRNESSGYYAHVEPKLFFVGTGMYVFSDTQLKKYREIVTNPVKAEELESIIRKLEKKNYKMGGKTYKQTPRGFDKEYEYRDLYLFSGVYAYYESKNLKEILESDFTDFCFKIFKEHLPLHNWLVKNIG
ncbi:MAG: DUF2461 domain-containing protein [Ignavibacteriaceae bacterium]